MRSNYEIYYNHKKMFSNCCKCREDTESKNAKVKNYP